MEKVFVVFFLHPYKLNFWYEIIDIFEQMASTSIKHVQLADGCNPKYTLRHMGITPKVMSKSSKGHSEVKSVKKAENS